MKFSDIKKVKKVKIVCNCKVRIGNSRELITAGTIFVRPLPEWVLCELENKRPTIKVIDVELTLAERTKLKDAQAKEAIEEDVRIKAAEDAAKIEEKRIIAAAKEKKDARKQKKVKNAKTAKDKIEKLKLAKPKTK